MNNTIKKLTLISMALVLCVCCIAPSFSWYNHNEAKDDKTAMYYNRENLPVSGYLASDNLSMTTYEGAIDDNGEVSYEKTPLASGTKITAEASTDEEYKTTCYKTVLENTSAKNVRVGLYLETADFGTGTDICFGTSDPIWRRLSADSMSTVAKPHKGTTNTMRVYYKRTYYSDTGEPIWSETEFYVNAQSNEYNSNVYKMSRISEDSDYYYADIPSDSTEFYISCEETESFDHRRTGNISVSDSHLSATNSVLVALPGGLDGDNKYMKYEVSDVTGANVANYVSTLFLTTAKKEEDGTINPEKNKTAIGSVALESGKYTGTVSYKSENPGIATVDSNGKVTGLAEGTAVIDITVTGEYGDTYTVKSVVNIQNPNQTVPLVQNVLVKAGAKAEVCWYIDNKTTTKLTDIKLMLTL
ncbi:MAG: Ig-like domain-containing protein [Ruminococcus sp.]